MTAERERLVGALREAMAVKAGRDHSFEAVADRLIAAGVHLDIDEERLARALNGTYLGWDDGERSGSFMFKGEKARDLAAAIAAAYREAAK